MLQDENLNEKPKLSEISINELNRKVLSQFIKGVEILANNTKVGQNESLKSKVKKGLESLGNSYKKQLERRGLDITIDKNYAILTLIEDTRFYIDTTPDTREVSKDFLEHVLNRARELSEK